MLRNIFLNYKEILCQQMNIINFIIIYCKTLIKLINKIYKKSNYSISQLKLRYQ